MTTATDAGAPAPTPAGERVRAADEIRRRRRFVLTSHVRPDGDALGSELAMAYALRHLGKDVRIVNRDPAPPPLRVFPGVAGIEIADRVEDPGDAVIVMESGDLGRTGVAGLERGFVINIDHHVGNTMFGAVNWCDLSAAACGEMVFDLIGDLGVPITPEIAVHIYVAILTDTGSFHYSNITPRTFEISRRCVEGGVDPQAVARSVYNNHSLGRVRLFGAILDAMQLDPSGRIATLVVDHALAAAAGGTYDDTDGLINFPLTAKEIQAVVFFKEAGPGQWRVSMRSKGDIDVHAVAREFGGGGHRNASGCTVSGRLTELTRVFDQRVAAQIDRWTGSLS